MLEDVTNELPARMKRFGCELHKSVYGNTIKFVLTNAKHKYRGFLYMRANYTPENGTSLQDLYSNFSFETGFKKIAGKYD